MPWLKLKDGKPWMPIGAITLLCDGHQTPFHTTIEDFQAPELKYTAAQIARRWAAALVNATDANPPPKLRRKGNTLFFPLGKLHICTFVHCTFVVFFFISLCLSLLHSRDLSVFFSFRCLCLFFVCSSFLISSVEC